MRSAVESSRMPIRIEDLNIHGPACYCIRARGTLDMRWSHWLYELDLVVESGPDGSVVMLRGTLRDQAELMGVLNQLSQMGMPLISVELVADDD
jgi:hypothetical protein